MVWIGVSLPKPRKAVGSGIMWQATSGKGGGGFLSPDVLGPHLHRSHIIMFIQLARNAIPWRKGPFFESAPSRYLSTRSLEIPSFRDIQQIRLIFKTSHYFGPNSRH